jgi:ribonuclease HII
MSKKNSDTKKSDEWISAVIIDDDDDDDNDLKLDEDTVIVDEDTVIVNEDTLDKDTIEITPISKRRTKTKTQTVEEVVQKKKRNSQQPLKICFDNNTNIIELGIDEAGRGPMFGRVYAGLVVLPKDDSIDHSQMKDSKKFHSKKKIEQVAEYIKENALAWAVEYEDEQTIDDINILQATQSAMHKCIKTVLTKLTDVSLDRLLLLVDGNYFKPYTTLNKTKTKMETIKYQLIEGGDNKYTSIAAASILAKVERDKYIEDLCVLNPELIEHYGIDSNKGYGSKKHMDGIKEHGITKWHRKTFGICKEFA